MARWQKIGIPTKLLLAIFLVDLGKGVLCQNPPCCISIRAGLGTSLALGVSYSFELNFRLTENVDIGGNLLAASSLRNTTADNHSYSEKTVFFFMGGHGTRFFKYRPEEVKPYFSLGLGAGYLSYQYEKRSPTDDTLGEPFFNGGSMQANFVNASSLLLVIGAGYTFKGPLDLRLEIPTILPLHKSVEPIPLFSLAAGFSF